MHLVEIGKGFYKNIEIFYRVMAVFKKLFNGWNINGIYQLKNCKFKIKKSNSTLKN